MKHNVTRKAELGVRRISNYSAVLTLANHINNLGYNFLISEKKEIKLYSVP